MLFATLAGMFVSLLCASCSSRSCAKSPLSAHSDFSVFMRCSTLNSRKAAMFLHFLRYFHDFHFYVFHFCNVSLMRLTRLKSQQPRIVSSRHIRRQQPRVSQHSVCILPQFVRVATLRKLCHLYTHTPHLSHCYVYFRILTCMLTPIPPPTHSAATPFCM